jgi:hypothetical protein
MYLSYLSYSARSGVSMGSMKKIWCNQPACNPVRPCLDVTRVKIERRAHPVEKGIRLEPWASAHIVSSGSTCSQFDHNGVVRLSCPASHALPPRPRRRSPSRAMRRHSHRGLHLTLLLLLLGGVGLRPAATPALR